jgi:hypothetical protein
MERLEPVDTRFGARHGEWTRVLLKPQKTQGREGMTRHHRTSSIVVFAFVALLAAFAPSVAPANSLLSGYGGPGQGNQAILGSALVNTPKGGGGGGAAGGGGEASSSQPAESSSSQPAGSASSRTGGAGKPASGGHAKRRPTASTRGDRGTKAGTARGDSVIYPAASREVATGGSRTLGLSGADFAYIILALGVLALTGFLTMRLGRTRVARGPDGRL